MLKRLLTTSVLVVLVGAASGANAFTSDKRTYFTFSQPVALPGVTLPAGTYMFLHPSPMTDYHIIQVMNEQQNQSFGFFLTIPNPRLTAASETVVTFRETPVGYIDTVQAWYYPDEKTGEEFVYSRKEAADIAKAIHQPVLSLPSPNRAPSTAAAPKK